MRRFPIPKETPSAGAGQILTYCTGCHLKTNKLYAAHVFELIRCYRSEFWWALAAIRTRWDLCCRWEKNHLTRKCGTPLRRGFWSRRLWLTRSNAFLKSTTPPWSNVVCQAWSIAVSAWVVDLPRRQPNWFGSNWGSSVVRIHSPTMDSNIFAMHGRKLVWGQSAWNEVLGLFKTGITTVAFQTGGKYNHL